jgi:hypothetical protein
MPWTSNSTILEDNRSWKVNNLSFRTTNVKAMAYHLHPYQMNNYQVF